MDWRDVRAAACNGGRNPIQQNFYDGINADPLEVLFIKVKGSMRAAGWEHVAQVCSRHAADFSGEASAAVGFPTRQDSVEPYNAY